MSKYTAAAISIGSINPLIGKTKYGYNVFDGKAALYECGGRLLYSIPGIFRTGDIVEIRDNDNNRKLQTLTVQHECLTQAELISFLAMKGYNMIKSKPFQKTKGIKYSPKESYSIKGVQKSTI